MSLRASIYPLAPSLKPSGHSSKEHGAGWMLAAGHVSATAAAAAVPVFGFVFFVFVFVFVRVFLKADKSIVLQIEGRIRDERLFVRKEDNAAWISTFF